MKKVLIVSYYFPPKNMLASKRYGLMCKYMNRCGWDPYVITMNSKGDLHVPINEDHIIRIGNENRNSSHIIKMHQSLIVLLAEAFKLSFRSINRDCYVWLNDVMKEIKRIKEICPDPDIIVGTFPPLGNILVARYLAKQYKVPWLAEIRDLISQYNDDVPKGWKKSKLLDLYVEKHLLSTASGIVTVTEGFKTILKKYYHKKFVVVYNGWDVNEEDPNNIETNLPENYIYYAGSLYEHRMESLYLLLSALKNIPDSYNVKVVIRIVGEIKVGSKILKYIKENNLTNRVLIEKSCKESMVRAESSKSMINLVLSDLDENKPYLLSTIPGKLMELIGEHPPILAIVNPKAEIADILSKTNKGIATYNKDKIARYIMSDYKNFEGNSKIINKFSRRYQTKKLCKFMDSIVR